MVESIICHDSIILRQISSQNNICISRNIIIILTQHSMRYINLKLKIGKRFYTVINTKDNKLWCFRLS